MELNQLHEVRNTRRVIAYIIPIALDNATLKFYIICTMGKPKTYSQWDSGKEEAHEDIKFWCNDLERQTFKKIEWYTYPHRYPLIQFNSIEDKKLPTLMGIDKRLDIYISETLE